MDALVNNFTIFKCGIASLQGYTSNQLIPNNYLNFYYESVNSKLELWLISGSPSISDIGSFTNNSFTNQRLGYITWSVSKSTATGINIFDIISNNLTISNLIDDVITHNYIDCMYDLNVYGNLNSSSISGQYNNLYNITSNKIDSYLFHSSIATIDTLTNTIIARMADVYSDNLYNSSIIVCDNDIYTNNLMSNSLCSLSDRIILNQNLTLQYPFVTPNNENQLGYQIIGTIIGNGTSITSGTIYTLSTITLTHGVWNVFGQIAYKCSSASASPLISSNGFGIANNTTTFGNYRIEN